MLFCWKSCRDDDVLCWSPWNEQEINNKITFADNAINFLQISGFLDSRYMFDYDDTANRLNIGQGHHILNQNTGVPFSLEALKFWVPALWQQT